MMTRKRARLEVAVPPVKECATSCVPLTSRKAALRRIAALQTVTDPAAVEHRLAEQAPSLHGYIDLCMMIYHAPRCDGASGATEILRLSSEEYSLLSDAEDASNKTEEKRESLRQGLDASTRAATGGGAIVCRKCSGDDVTIQQKQTRSADEGMTIFCTCESCGHKWRMS